jgi:hypothetical protein
MLRCKMNIMAMISDVENVGIHLFLLAYRAKTSFFSAKTLFFRAFRAQSLVFQRMIGKFFPAHRIEEKCLEYIVHMSKSKFCSSISPNTQKFSKKPFKKPLRRKKKFFFREFSTSPEVLFLMPKTAPRYLPPLRSY